MRSTPTTAAALGAAASSWLAAALAGCVIQRDEVGILELSGGGASTTALPSGDTGSAAEADDSEGDSTATAAGDDDSVYFDLGSDGGLEGECACAPHVDLIYVLSTSKELWTFDPTTLEFALVGPIPCEQQHGFDASTFSMGVGRDGRAWIQYNDGDLYTVDVNDPQTCVDPGFEPGQLDIGTFGMSFVSNDETDPCDRIYGRSANIFTNRMLAVLDPESLLFTGIAVTEHEWVELAGTGDGQLFEFINNDVLEAPLLIRLDRETGAELETLELQGVPTGGSFAFAFWGGDFYFFSGDAFGTSVSKLDWDESDGQGQAVTVVVEDAPVIVVGAGSSTCVPIGPVG
ncbi:MAG: hypothetical protein AAF799_09875 [Myxococcota bacterium]